MLSTSIIIKRHFHEGQGFKSQPMIISCLSSSSSPRLWGTHEQISLSLPSLVRTRSEKDAENHPLVSRAAFSPDSLKPNATQSWISYHTTRKEDHQLVLKQDPPLFGSTLCSEDSLFKVKRQRSFTEENQGGGKAATAKSPHLTRSTRPATAA